LFGLCIRIHDQQQKVSDVVAKLKKLSNTGDKKKEYSDQLHDTQHRLDFYKEHGVEGKLQKQVDFDRDERKCTEIISFIQ
jgi:hypothetical protein